MCVGLLATVKAQSSGKAQDDQQLEHASRWFGRQGLKLDKDGTKKRTKKFHVLNMTNFGITDLNTKS